MTRVTALLAFASIALLAGCATDNERSPASPAAADSSIRAHAELASASGSDVSGRLSFVDTTQGVRITGRIAGLEPGSTHGFHIHEHGDCSTPDASSAGGHFNPTQQPHGHPAEGPRHAGDLPNQQANAEGVATVDVLAKDIQLGTGDSTDIMGDAVIVHEKPDDYSSQPSGNAGARIACGVITRD
ncbi:MAG: superoxide dismutase family protein [Rhodanobacteraceae bacterium]